MSKLNKYFGKICKICGHSFGLHSSLLFHCPDIPVKNSFKRTYFKFGKFRKEVKE